MSVFLLALLGALIPSLAWLRFFYRRDAYDPEPIGLIVRLFLIGALPVVFAAGILNAVGLLLVTGGDAVDPSAETVLILAVFIAPVTEESLKYIGTALGVRRSPAFNEPLDGIIYGTTVGLGFAAVETVSYLTDAYAGTGLLGPIDFCESGAQCLTYVAIIRGLGSAVLHACASGIACYGLSRRKEGASRIRAFGWVALAMLMHALWNALSFLVLAIPIIIYAQLVKRQLARSPFLARALAGYPPPGHRPDRG